MSEDWQACRRILARHSKSFDWASRLLPREKRDEVAALYAWCRRCDDAIDLVEPERQPRALDALRRELASVYAGEPQTDASLACFQRVVLARGIPVEYPRALLDGMAMDVERTTYETLDALLIYCWRVAGAVGLMMCHVLGVSDARAGPHAAHLGIAMQLTNIARDVAEDWLRGRVYLPREWLDGGLLEWLDAHVDERPPPALPPAFRAALADPTRRLLVAAERYYASADRGMAFLEPRSALTIRSARLIYAEIGRVLEDRGCDVTRGRVSVPARRKARLTLAALGRFLQDRGAWRSERLAPPERILDAEEAVRLT